jgi:hypothetical protein
MVLWPIIEPLLQTVQAEDQETALKTEVQKLFFTTLQKKKRQKSEKEKIRKLLDDKDQTSADFIFSLFEDFTASFYEEILQEENPGAVLKAIRLLINQQILIAWIEQLIEQSMGPILIFSISSVGKIEKAKQAITRILLATLKQEIKPEEATNQLEQTLQQDYQLGKEGLLFIKSLVQTVGRFRELYGLDELAKIGEQSLIVPTDKLAFVRINKRAQEAIEDQIIDREQITEEWIKNIVKPATIGLRMAGEEKYNAFLDQCITNFQLFLDNTLSADDFEKRLRAELEKFGGSEEKLIKPIQDSIANAVKFLELARKDDPSLGLLLMLIDEEREETKRGCI